MIKPVIKRTLNVPMIVALVAAVALLISPVSLLAQAGNQGTVAVTVQDPSGALVPGAKLDLVEVQSNSARSATTDSKGAYSFVNLNTGTYHLTVSREGFQTKVYDNVLVDSSTVTPITVMLPVGTSTQTVVVSSQANAALQTSSTEIGTVINTTDIENLPIGNRNISTLTTLTAGYSGTWNGVPEPAEGTNIDGLVANNGRTKYQGTISTQVAPRVESFEQVSVVTDGLNLGNGFGQASMQLNYVSRRGGNRFHGRAFYNFQNSGLNANSWGNDATVDKNGNWAPTRKAKLIKHDFGVSVGGPIFKDKLFFFGTYAEFKQPGTITTSDSIFTSAALAGNFTYYSGTTPITVNVLTLANAYNPYGAGQINPDVNALVQKAIKNTQGLSGSPATSTDNTTNTVSFSVPGTQTQFYPVVRLDYNVSDKLRMYLSWLMTESKPVGSYPAPFPGSDYADQAGNNFTRNFDANYGIDYIFNPRVINQLKVGFAYSRQQFAGGSKQNWLTNPLIQFNMTNANGNMSGQNYILPTGYEYPLFSLTDGVTIQKGAHNISFGFQGYREQDHYYNAPFGYPNIGFGLASGDPAANVFTSTTMPNSSSAQRGEAGQLFAVLTGRISGVNGMSGYNPAKNNFTNSSFYLDEVALSSGVWAQDSWKIAPTLTMNYGLRWDFYVDPHDIKSAYHNAKLDSILGPTTLADLFKPGALNGNQNPALSLNPRPFHGYYKTPQPQVALNWNPRPDRASVWGRLLGDGATSIRAGFGLRNFTQPYQFYWDAASDQGQLYLQQWGLTANTTGVAGSFQPGSLNYAVSQNWGGTNDRNPNPAGLTYFYNPATFPTSAPLSLFTLNGGGIPVDGFNPNIRMPYTESWNFGIQRALARNTVLEVRYNGNRTIHNWTMLNYNEVNIFGSYNGDTFLNDFKNAQANLAASGGTSFVDTGTGRVATPIIDAAFKNQSLGSTYTSSTYITYLQTGAAGTFARQLAGRNPTFFCNLVGASFTPCATNAGFTGAGAGYPINLFQANPYNPGNTTGYMTDAAYSNYNGLQVDLREAGFHGLQGDFNYTWAKTLGFGTNNNDYLANADNFYTLRNLHLSYVPQSFDIRHVFHGYGTYELPFGKGKAFLDNSTLANEIVGGFSLGTVMTFQTGSPFSLTGGYSTYNQNDGGVTLNGITPAQLQSQIGHRYVGGGLKSELAFDPSLYQNGAKGGPSVLSKLAPNTTAGTIGSIVWLHGPSRFTQDMALTKLIPIKEGTALTFQAEFLNVWNHPTWGTPNGSVQSGSFGTSGIATGARAIELRGNFTF
ncbi:MAG TPA: carboxypeptidase-like regulatory domain-containing protein [Acidobacteriaceae bacterium]|nr:carboxypeptidase-like regulatory domain-containing protein [Acidobacteriaceae bacterium]